MLYNFIYSSEEKCDSLSQFQSNSSIVEDFKSYYNSERNKLSNIKDINEMIIIWNVFLYFIFD